MNITEITTLFTKQYRGKQITPGQIVEKLRIVIRVMDVLADPDKMPIRISIGKPKKPTATCLDDWTEECCELWDNLPKELCAELYTVYEVWYDTDEYDYAIEIMMYKE